MTFYNVCTGKIRSLVVQRDACNNIANNLEFVQTIARFLLSPARCKAPFIYPDPGILARTDRRRRKGEWVVCERNDK